ncbi:MAG: DUF1311 domain-containing protein [Verrucomicrobiales bacterium]|nr:DUF1311 domain-containing protein [Verrucomicrobiales bacterium]
MTLPVRSLCLLLAAVQISLADTDAEEKHPLDKAYEEEEAKPQPERDISRRFAEKWDAELNRLYKEMMSGLSPNAAAALKKSQQAWIQYRDAQFAMIAEFFSIEGMPSMYSGFAAHARMNVVRLRVLDLAKRWETYKMLRSEVGDPVRE